jgi:hypothetical protein
MFIAPVHQQLLAKTNPENRTTRCGKFPNLIGDWSQRPHRFREVSDSRDDETIGLSDTRGNLGGVA